MLIFVYNNLIICNLPVRDRPRVGELSPFLSAVTLIMTKQGELTTFYINNTENADALKTLGINWSRSQNLVIYVFDTFPDQQWHLLVV